VTDSLLYWALVALGIVANMVLAIEDDSRSNGKRVWPRQYIRRRPYACALGVVGGVAAGFWMAGDVAKPRMGLVAGLAGTAFLERLSKRRITEG